LISSEIVASPPWPHFGELSANEIRAWEALAQYGPAARFGAVLNLLTMSYVYAWRLVHLTSRICEGLPACRGLVEPRGGTDCGDGDGHICASGIPNTLLWFRSI
jgi:hypothetical protein